MKVENFTCLVYHYGLSLIPDSEPTFNKRLRCVSVTRPFSSIPPEVSPWRGRKHEIPQGHGRWTRRAHSKPKLTWTISYSKKSMYFFFYCHITNYQKCSVLKIAKSSTQSHNEMAVSAVCVLQRLNWGELPRGVNRIQFLVFVGLQSLLTC